MSRSFNQSHSLTRKQGQGSKLRDPKVQRKMKPYGRLDHIGYGEEVYVRSHGGEIRLTHAEKHKERKNNKIDIYTILDED
jgi:hypothetical protein